MPAAIAVVQDDAHARRPRSAVQERAARAAIETFAVLRARLDADHPRARVLSDAGLDEAAWQQIESWYDSVLCQEARQTQRPYGQRYSAAYAEEWAKHAPRFASAPSRSRDTNPPPARKATPVPTLASSAAPVDRAGKSGTISIDVSSLQSPRLPAHLTPPPRPVIPVEPPPPIGGTMVMEVAAPVVALSPSASIDTRELERFVAVSASLAATRDRDRVLAHFGMSLQEWVTWSARMGQRLANDPALRERYSRLLQETLTSSDRR